VLAKFAFKSIGSHEFLIADLTVETLGMLPVVASLVPEQALWQRASAQLAGSSMHLGSKSDDGGIAISQHIKPWSNKPCALQPLALELLQVFKGNHLPISS